MRARAEIALLALAALAFELALTRVASFLLQYHYTYLAVALGLGGMGLGTALGALRPTGELGRATAAVVAAVGFAAALAAPRIAPGCSLAALAALVALPAAGAFAAAGYALGLALEQARSAPRGAYAADVAGAAAGTVLALGAMEIAGPALAGVAAIAAASAAAVLAARGGPARVAVSAVALALCGFALLASPRAESASPQSPLGHRLRAGGRALAARWDAYARTDLVSVGALGFEEIYADGTAPALVVLGAADPSVAAAHRRDLPYVPFRLRRPERVLSLGGGAGYDAWLALLAGARRVDVVEINGAALAFAAERTGTSADALRDRRVRAFRDDGRRFLRRHGDSSYDLIVLALYQGEADARASVALLEASGYTQEALRDYLGSLRPGGRVAVLLHDAVLLERLRRTAEAVLGRGGAFVSLEHPAGAPYRYLAYFGADPLDGSERAALAEVQQGGRFRRVRRVRDPALDLSPTRDERPFFFHTEGRPPGPLLWMALGPSMLALAWLAARRRAPPHAATRIVALLCGAGYASLELLLVERFRFALGLPVTALATVTVALLAGAAAGSVLGGRGRPAGVRPAGVALALLSAALGVAGPAFRDLGGEPVVVGVAAALALGIAAGLAAGRPLPAALERAARQPGGVAELWGLSALAAVAGAAIFVLVAMQAGYAAAAAVPALAYAAVAVAWRTENG